MRKLQNFVGGAYRDAEDGPSAPLIDPSTGEPFAEAPVSGAADVDRALRVAADAFTSWRRTTPSERSLALIRIADALEARAEDLVRAECENTGKPFQLTMDEEIPPDGRPDPLLRRRRPPPRGPGSRRSTWPGTRRSSGASRSACAGRSPRGTTR